MPKTAGILGVLLLLIGQASSPGGSASPRECRRHLVDNVFPCTETLDKMWLIQTAVEAYALDHKVYPQAKSMGELKSLIESDYVKTASLKDAWGTDFQYLVSADHLSYKLVSAGSDRVFDERSWSDAGFLSSSKEDALLTSAAAAGREWVIQE